MIVSEIYSNGNITNYSYNSENLLTSLESGGDVLTFNYDNDGNLIEKFFDSQIIDSFEYDGKINPFILLGPENYNKIIFEGKHNMTYRMDGERNIVYEYNSEDLPIKSTYTDIGGFVQVREYFYEN
ncbi:YD repeat-containing protein [Flaviramulus basaltis]|uniref:YD repeat-containing protein n=1 Tax=Flaviramulus basaltis TaxID=369401 RepID=A0A1K2IHU2_9FLAO|nr:hypothetical protein [Flaviramulus basaltis]SFZ91800.1 YD repeat-containing protein [Flaviramulus basaltis]